MAKLAETTYRDVNIGLANQFARFAEKAGIDVYQVIEASQLPALQPHPPPGHRRRRPLHPGLPAPLPLQRPRRHRRPAAREANAAMPGHAVGLPSAYGDLAGARVVVLGAAYRGGVKETAFSGVFATGRELQAQRGARSGCTTRCTPTPSSGRSVSSRTTWAHPWTPPSCRPTTRYAELTAAELPGVRVVVDGRNLLPDLGEDVLVRTLGKPAAGPQG